MEGKFKICDLCGAEHRSGQDGEYETFRKVQMFIEDEETYKKIVSIPPEKIDMDACARCSSKIRETMGKINKERKSKNDVA